jgi:S-DNA-T family DNA segregation ATPase FtsK/SpoIIIE
MATRGRPALLPGHILREAEAITGGAVAIFLALALFSFAPDAPRSNLGGPVGHAIADAILHALGVAAYLFPVYLGYLTIALLRRGAEDLGGLRFAGAAVLVVAVAAFAGLVTGGGGRAVLHGGGWLGGFIATVLSGFLGGLGAALVLTVVVAFAVVLSTGMSAIDLTERAVRWLAAHARDVGERAWTALRARVRREAVPALDGRPARKAAPKPIPLVEVDDEDDAPPAKSARNELPPIIREPERKPEPKRDKPKRFEEQEELFVEDAYRLPALTLLDAAVRSTQPIDEAALHASSRILETKLADFGVAGKVVAVRPGPVITTFEFEPAPGVKVSRIVNLADDLAMALRAASVRILAPIPGKPVVGVEVSNPRRETVYIREVLQSDGYKGGESKLTLALGKDTTSPSPTSGACRTSSSRARPAPASRCR